MTTPFKSEKLHERAQAFSSPAKKLLLFFPELEWNLKRAGYNISAVEYLAITLLFSVGAFAATASLSAIPMLMNPKNTNPIISAGFPIGIAAVVFFYILFMPKLTMVKQGKQIDKNLEYMLKDMQIQMTAGLPMFNALTNIAAGGYGACSGLVQEIVKEVESGTSMRDVLNSYGMLSPSEYMRRVLWQIANAMQTGSDVKIALIAISNDIREEKENKIKAYGQEMSIWGLIYMMMVIVAPSMGITLLVVLSSFVGSQGINKSLFDLMFVGILIFQLMFISIVRSKRPNIG